jgi:hypothetical protein
MTLEKARELIQVQVDLGGGYNRNSIRILLGEVKKAHNQEAVDKFIKDFSLDTLFGLKVGEDMYL